MEECEIVQNTGLRGVTIASTKISDVDGKKGKLVYRGYLAKDLAGKVTFEEVAFLLLYEKLPTQAELAAFSVELIKNRELPQNIFAAMTAFPKDALPMDVLQAMVPMLAHHDKGVNTHTRENALAIAIKLIAKFPGIVAAWDRIRNGKAPIDPDPTLGHAANFFFMLTGEVPDQDLAGFFDTALVLHAEHSFNASTFAAREVASTKAHMYASVTAAVGSLSGALHGGANTRVMNMLKDIGAADKVEAYVQNILDTGGVIMGLGHAVYQTDDPRAHILAPMSKTLGQRAGDTTWYDLSKKLEIVGKQAFKEKKGREIYVNVDFYSASLYHYMGIASDLFTPLFAISRISGWAAHVIEEQFGGAAAKPALYRPESDYIGDYCGPDECTFVPVDDR
ncbi:MAG: citrate (Si)-synthase [Desulfobacterales bacterium]|nr:citrate (Si)-synthase [Desulfobacterales bacterium]